MAPVERLLNAANIRPSEGRIVAWVFLFTVLCFAASVLAYSAAYAIFLNVFSAQRLPFVYIGESIVSTLASLLYLQLSKRYSLARLLVGNVTLLTLSIVGYRGGLAVATGEWLLFTLPIWYGVFNTLMYIAFWNLLGRLFNLQQGKRLFGLFTGGQLGVTLLVGFMVPALLTVLATQDLLIVAALVAGGAVAVLVHITRMAPALHEVERDEPEEGTAPAPGKTGLLADPYVRLLFLMYLLFAFGDYFVDNIFYAELELQFTDPDQVAGFLGVFTGVVGGLSLLIHLFLSRAVLSRFGVRTVILLTPVLLLMVAVPFTGLGALSVAAVLLFWLASGMNLTRQLTDAFDNTAANLLYQPLPAALRTQTQTAVDGILYPIAAGVTGLVLLWLTAVLQFTPVQLGFVLVPILVLWALTAMALGRRYPQRVQEAMHRRIVHGNPAFIPDRASLDVIHQNLRNPHPGAAIYASNVLEAMDGALFYEQLPGLLEHPHAEVRLHALACLERSSGRPLTATLWRLFEREEEPRVRGAALRTLATVGGTMGGTVEDGVGDGEELDRLLPFLASPDPVLRQAVMTGLLRSGELGGVLAAGEALAQIIRSPEDGDRIFAARVLAESGINNLFRPLLALLGDGEAPVRRAAMVAAGKLQQPRLWPMVANGLREPATRPAAQVALIAAGPAALPVLEAHLAAAGSDTALRLALAQVLARWRTAPAAALLFTELDFPDVRVRMQALRGLYLCRFQANGNEQRRAIEAQIMAEIAHAAWMLAVLADLEGEAKTALLRGELSAALVRQQGRLFLWLSLLYDAAPILRAADAFGGPLGAHRYFSEEQRAYALEILDVTVAKRLSRAILPLLEELSPEQRRKRLAADFPQTAHSVVQRLQEIITADGRWISPWLRAVALFVATLLPTQLLDEQTLQRLASTASAATPDAVVHETAAWALFKAGVGAAVTVGGGNVKDNQVKDNQVDGSQVDGSRQAMAAVDPTDDKGGASMLLTVEKVMILKTVDIFAHAPADILVDIAALLKETEMEAGATIFEKGAIGDSMYIIVEGAVEARDGAQIFARMGEREVFGEMALLDGDPRTATIYTVQPTRLLRLDQEPFYELMDDHIEIARGVIHVLLQRLRARTDDVNRLRAQLTTA
jgi:ATP:ADP antiporter, AAA family